MSETVIDSETLQKMLAQKEPVTILDIRPTKERAEWAIPGSLHIDVYDALKAGDPGALSQVHLPPDRLVVTVCGAGKTSLLAAEQLRAQGIPAVSLAGGMKAWSLAWNSAEMLLPAGETRLIQIRRTGKGCLSYLVGAEGLAAVVDAALEPEVYISLARDQGWRITAVLDTHIHADHLSRSRQLAEECGATLFLPAQDRVSYPFNALRENDVVNIGAFRLVALHTPGHTPESTCYLLDNQALLTGDTLFLTGVGRPDLEVGAGEARRQAHMLYHSLQGLLTLPPETLILPGHTSTPVAFDGQALVATLAEVSQRVEFLSLSEGVFVEQILARIPPAPPNHHRIVELNEAGNLPEGDLTELEAGANRCAVG